MRCGSDRCMAWDRHNMWVTHRVHSKCWGFFLETPLNFIHELVFLYGCLVVCSQGTIRDSTQMNTLAVLNVHCSLTVFGNTGFHLILRGSVRPQSLPYIKLKGMEPEFRSPTPEIPNLDEVSGMIGSLTVLPHYNASHYTTVHDIIRSLAIPPEWHNSRSLTWVEIAKLQPHVWKLARYMHILTMFD